MKAPETDDEVKKRMRSISRRSFAIGGVAIASGFGAWKWLTTRSVDEGIPWPLRRVLQLNEKISKAAFSPDRLAPDFALSRAQMPRVNGLIGLRRNGAPVVALDPSEWRLTVESGEPGGRSRSISIDEIKALPRHEQTTELKCIEGWSTIVHWGGARLADLAASTGLASRTGAAFDPSKPPADLFDYVSLVTPNEDYYVGLDMPSALHPQTLLCYEMNGEPLTPSHGAPLRLAIPVKYGIKNIQRIGTLRFTDRKPADYWAERGYDWYAGH